MASSCSCDMLPIMFSIMDIMPGLSFMFFIMSAAIVICQLSILGFSKMTMGRRLGSRAWHSGADV